MRRLQPRKRLYRTVAVIETAPGFAIALDGHRLQTPARSQFQAPTRALAEACAAEWERQGEHVAPATMPLTQLGFAAADWACRNRDDLVGFVVKFAETDLCCHRADAPDSLVARQAAAWDPLVSWGAQTLGVELPVVTGIAPAAIDPAQMARLAKHASALGDFHLTALAQAAGLAGSALIGFGLLRGWLDAEAAFAAAALDNLWSLEHWGEDEEARANLNCIRMEFQALARFVVLLDGRR